jgi:hypothetical protein
MSRNWTMLTWREQTWSERAQTALANLLATVIGLAMFVGAIVVIGECLDGVSRYKSEHDRCLKQATNGYDIKRCN